MNGPCACGCGRDVPLGWDGMHGATSTWDEVLGEHQCADPQIPWRTVGRVGIIALFVVLAALGLLQIYIWLVEVYAPSINLVS